MDKFLLPLEEILKKIIFVLMALILILTFLTVITRYCFSYTPAYSEELARYMFVWIVFLSLPIVTRQGSNMAIEMLISRTRGMVLKTMLFFSGSCTIVFLLIMIFHGFTLVTEVSYQTSPALDISMSYVYIVIPFGCAIMLLNVAQQFVTLLRTPADQLEPPQGGE